MERGCSADRALAAERPPLLTESKLDFIPIPAEGVDSCKLDGELLVWRGPILHRLDGIGTLVWECFDGRTTLAGIVRILAEAFHAPESEVHRGVVELCDELHDVGLLEGGHLHLPDPPPHIRMGRPPSVPLDLNVELPYSTQPFRALDHDFAIRSNDFTLVKYFGRSLKSFAVSGDPARWYSVVATSHPDERYRIYLDDEGLFAAPDADGVARYLLWHINFEVITGASPHLLIHAAGATMSGQAVVLPGQMNAGKTTLVAGLVLDGLQFLTDELVAINLGTRLIDPYPRPLNIGFGSWEALSSLRPSDRDEQNPFPELMWHVEPTTIRPDVVAQPSPLRWVIAPRFEEGAPTSLEPVSRPEAAVLLYRHAFNQHRWGGDGVKALVAAVSRTRCARIVSGDLAGAVDAVRQFMEEEGPA